MRTILRWGNLLYPQKPVKKRQKEAICAKCQELINIGTEYIPVKYDDGFVDKIYGAYHPECWEQQLTLQDKLIVNKVSS